MSINSINSNNVRSKTKSSSFAAKTGLLIFLALAGNWFIQQASAQTRNITKDTTEIRNFFKDPKIFSATEMKEFDTLRNKNLKSPIRWFIQGEVMSIFDDCNDYEQTVVTCLILDPSMNTSLWKWANEEIKKSSGLKLYFDLVLKHINNQIQLQKLEVELKEKQTELKEAQEVLKRLKEFEKILLEVQKKFEQDQTK